MTDQQPCLVIVMDNPDYDDFELQRYRDLPFTGLVIDVEPTNGEVLFCCEVANGHDHGYMIDATPDSFCVSRRIGNHAPHGLDAAWQGDALVTARRTQFATTVYDQELDLNTGRITTIDEGRTRALAIAARNDNPLRPQLIQTPVDQLLSDFARAYPPLVAHISQAVSKPGPWQHGCALSCINVCCLELWSERINRSLALLGIG